MTYMSLIIDKLRKEKKNPSKTQIAYAISICETYLNPNNQNIQMSESIMKLKIINNLVSFNLQFAKCELFELQFIYLFIDFQQKLENRDKFSHSDDDFHDGNEAFMMISIIFFRI